MDELWYRDLRHERSFYTNVTTKQLLTHLDDNCGGLHPSELVNLPTDMLGYYASTEGIPEFINSLEAAQRKLARANLPMSDDQLLAIASTAVLAANDFLHPTYDWEAKPNPEQPKLGQHGKCIITPPIFQRNARCLRLAQSPHVLIPLWVGRT